MSEPGTTSFGSVTVPEARFSIMSLTEPTPGKPSGTTRIARAMVSRSAAARALDDAGPRRPGACRPSSGRSCGPCRSGPRSIESRSVAVELQAARRHGERRRCAGRRCRWSRGPARRSTSVWEISSGSFGSTLNGLRASMVFVIAPMRPSSVWPGDEHLIAGDVVGELELDRRLAALGQDEDRVPVDRLGEVAADLAERRVALVGVLADDERRQLPARLARSRPCRAGPPP